MPPIIGIDLGTTNSCAALVEESGQVRLIPYKGGDFTIPSIFAIDDKGRELVGHEAKRQWQLNPKNTVYGSKRLIGRSTGTRVVERWSRTVPYRVVDEGERNLALEVAGRRFSLSDVAARILGKIIHVAEEHLHEKVTQAVVTVPAYFNDRQRQAVKEAGSLIGLSIPRIINEPTAAALAYGFGKKLHETILVYDLGGGTFDVSIIAIRDQVFEVKATGGDIFLGGIDFDEGMIQHVLRTFAAEHGLDLAADPVAMQRIKDLAEKTKIDLSSSEQVRFYIPFICMSAEGVPLNVELTFTRAQLDELVGPHVDRTLAIVDGVLADAGLTDAQIDQVMLVGGQTRMPLVQRRLTERFGKAPSKAVHPDEAVAVGAAIYGHSLAQGAHDRLQLLDVIPMAIGIEAAGGRFHRVFPRNASIPNARQLTATTSYAGQTELAMRIYQGDGDQVRDNELLGDFLFSGVRAGPAGSARVEITFDVSVEGILTLSARDPETGKELKTTIRM